MENKNRARLLKRAEDIRWSDWPAPVSWKAMEAGERAHSALFVNPPAKPQPTPMQSFIDRWASFCRLVRVDGPIPMEFSVREDFPYSWGCTLRADFLVTCVHTKAVLLLNVSNPIPPTEEPNPQRIQSMVRFVYRHEADEQIQIDGRRAFYPDHEHVGFR